MIHTIKRKLSSLIYRIRNKLFLSQIRKRNKNITPTIICNNCVAGVIYRQLGLKFFSPTINLFIEGEEYLLFVTNFEQYIQLPLIDVSCQFNVNYPVGQLSGNNLPPVHLNFLHYNSFEQAKNKWETRCKRINYSNLYFIWEFYDTLYDTKLLERFDKLKRNTIAITHRKLENIKNQFTVTCYDNDTPIAKILAPNGLSGKLFLNEWDYITFLNKQL